MFDYDNKNIGFKGDIYDFTSVYKQWLEKKTIVKITSDVTNVETGSLKEKFVLIGGICLGICIISFVLFYNNRRNLENRTHSELIEEKRTLSENIQLNNVEAEKKI